MSEKKPTIVALNSSRKKAESVSGASLTVENEKIDLESFVLSGVDVEGRRCVLTWNCSLDELASYSVVLDTVIRDKVREAINDER